MGGLLVTKKGYRQLRERVPCEPRFVGARRSGAQDGIMNELEPIRPRGSVPKLLGKLIRDRRGAVFVEFLIAFLPVQVFFLCLIQLAILYSVRLVTEHAAINGARAAAVVIGD